jgi:hypothetical protein
VRPEHFDKLINRMGGMADREDDRGRRLHGASQSHRDDKFPPLMIEQDCRRVTCRGPREQT